MARDGRNVRDTVAELEQPGNSLMPQIVKMQIINL